MSTSSITANTAHERAVFQAFTAQAAAFAAGPELHANQIVQWMVDAAEPKPTDRVIDLACGPGSVVCALAQYAAHATGLDATPAMLDEALQLADRLGRSNVTLRLGDVYKTPFEGGSFDAVTCRFAFHHFLEPTKALQEMIRIARRGARIVVCDAIAPGDRAEAFNAMERFRDPSTVAFRSLGYFQDLFADAGLESPEQRHFQVSYLAKDLVQASTNDAQKRADLLNRYEASVQSDSLGMQAQQTPQGLRLTYSCAVFTARKPF